MCQDCDNTVTLHIVDLIARHGWDLEFAIRLYRDEVVQQYLMEEPDERTSMEDLREVVGIINETAGKLRSMRLEFPKGFEKYVELRRERASE